MNKTVTINIAGLVFHIDEDAYNKLDSYINAVRNSIRQESEDEIIADIEARIAELFAARIDPQTGVIRMNNVDEIINIMGKPEDYIIEDEPQRTHFEYANTAKTYKKMYRDGENKILGGVCSGLGHYLNVDPVWIRIIFVLLLFLYGSSFIIYLVLWVIIPKARTVADVLEMKGEPVNISNIERQFRQGVSNSYQTLRTSGSAASVVIRKAIGITLIVFSVLGIFGSFFAPIAFNSEKNRLISEFITYNQAEVGIPFWVLSLCLFIMSAVPFIVLMLLGIKILNPKTKHIGWVSAVLGLFWLAAIFIFAYVMINLDIQKDKIDDMFEDNFETKISKNDLPLTTNDTLHIVFEKDPRIYTINDTLTGKKRYSEVKDVYVEILESNTGNAYVEIEEKTFNNKNLNIKALSKYNIEVKASEISNTLKYNYSIKSDTLVLSNGILTTLNDFTEDSNVRIKLYITDKQQVKINGSDNRYFWNQEIDLNGKNYFKFVNGELKNTNNTIH